MFTSSSQLTKPLLRAGANAAKTTRATRSATTQVGHRPCPGPEPVDPVTGRVAGAAVATLAPSWRAAPAGLGSRSHRPPGPAGARGSRTGDRVCRARAAEEPPGREGEGRGAHRAPRRPRQGVRGRPPSLPEVVTPTAQPDARPSAVGRDHRAGHRTALSRPAHAGADVPEEAQAVVRAPARLRRRRRGRREPNDRGSARGSRGFETPRASGARRGPAPVEARGGREGAGPGRSDD